MAKRNAPITLWASSRRNGAHLRDSTQGGRGAASGWLAIVSSAIPKIRGSCRSSEKITLKEFYSEWIRLLIVVLRLLIVELRLLRPLVMPLVPPPPTDWIALIG